jgi:hypothetical protein
LIIYDDSEYKFDENLFNFIERLNLISYKDFHSNIYHDVLESIDYFYSPLFNLYCYLNNSESYYQEIKLLLESNLKKIEYARDRSNIINLRKELINTLINNNNNPINLNELKYYNIEYITSQNLKLFEVDNNSVKLKDYIFEAFKLKENYER